MKRSILAGIIFGILGISSAVVIQGEWSPGVFGNYAIDMQGRLPVTIDTSTTPLNVTGTVGISGIPSVNINSMPAAATPSYSYRNLTGTGNTVIKTGSGKLQALIINTSGTLSSMVVYDNTTCSGTTIGTVGTLIAQSSLYYGVNFNTGLCITNNGTLAANVTVVYN